MFFPNSNSENVFVFDSATKFADAVAAFKRGANVFYQSGTTYDMMTAYEGGALKGSKYTVDENGVSESGGGGGAFVINIVAVDGGHYLDKTWNEIKSAVQARQVCLGYDIVNDITNISFVSSIYHDSNGYSVEVNYTQYTSETADGVLVQSSEG